MSKEEKLEELNQYLRWLESFKIDVGSRFTEIYKGGCFYSISAMSTETAIQAMLDHIERQIDYTVCERYRLEKDIEYDRVNSPVENENG